MAPLDSPNSRARSRAVTVRASAVIMLSLFGLLATLPGLMLVWHPVGTYGITSDAEGIVRAVDPQSPAARAQIVPGDELIGPLRQPIGEVWVSAPGVKTTTSVVHAGRIRQVTLSAQATRFAPGDSVLYPMRKLIAALFILIGAALVLARPSIATWGFFLYCVGDNPFATSGLLFATLPLSWFLLFVILRDVLAAAGIVGLLIFALNFPTIENVPWRTKAQPYLVVLLVLLTMTAIGVNLASWLGHALQWLLTLTKVIQNVVYVGIAAIFAETYVRTRGEDRQRIAWITFAFAVGLVGLAIARAASVIHWSVFSSVSLHERILALLIGLVPFAVAYAVVRHHVFNFNVVLSHALLYGIITAFIVALFAVIHSLAARTLLSAQVGLGVELLAAILIGFLLEASQRRIEQVIEAVFFRRRRHAKQRIEAAARALEGVSSKQAIDHVVVAEPAQAFDLRSAALFRLDEAGNYARRTALDWSAANAAHFAANDTVVSLLRSAPRPTNVERQRWLHASVPAGEQKPVYAFPILIRHRLAAFVLYGSQPAGELLDKDQIQVIEQLMRAAANAYDQLDIERLRALAAEAVHLRERLAERNADTIPNR